MGTITTPSAPSTLTPDDSLTDPTARRFRGSAKLSDYTLLKEKLGEGTFGIVSKARSKRTGAIVALKKILMHNEKEGFPITALREVKLLKMLHHPNVLRLEEMAVERIARAADTKSKSGAASTGQKRATLYMVMPYMDHDLSGMLTNPDIQFTEGQIKCYMLQLLEGLRYLHSSHILHRDMKAANLLISNKGILQIADFGLARHYEGQTPVEGGGNGVAVRDYTSLVVTRWYRPPELLLTLKRYTPAIDLWGVGCVFGEMFERKPILEGRTDQDQCHRIFKLVGSPSEVSMPGWSDLPGCEGLKEFEHQDGDIDQRFGQHMSKHGLSLLKSLLCLDWRKRVNAIDALKHPYFSTDPLPMRPEDVPRYEDSHELDARRRGHEKQRALPPAPAGGDVGMGPNEWNGNGPPPQYGYPGDRGPRRGGERGGPHPQRDDHRGGRVYPPPSDARAAPSWRQDQDRRPRGGPPAPNSQPLPPRPVDVPPPPPAELTGRGIPAVLRGDRYVPSYSGGDGPAVPPPRSREREYRDHDAPRPPTRESDRSDRDRGHRGYGDSRRTRSRSPDGGRREDWRARDDWRGGGRDRNRDLDGGGPGRDRDGETRERLRDRERDFYHQRR